MAIQFAVASLVLFHLRDEMDVIRARIQNYQNRADEIEIKFQKLRPGYQNPHRGVFRESDIFYIEDRVPEGTLSANMRDLSDVIIFLESQLNQITDTYNNVLILIRMDTDPSYQLPVKSERPVLYTPNGDVFR